MQTKSAASEREPQAKAGLRLVLLGVMASVGWGVCGCATSAPELRPAPAAGERVTTAGPAAKARDTEKFPTVMLMIEEKSMGTIATAEIDNLATEMLIKEQVPVVDQDLINAKINKQQQLLKIAGDPRGAAALGLQFGADVIIVGEVVSKPAARRIEGSNLRTYQGIATLRALRTGNGAALAAASAHASVIGVEDVAGSSEALRAAGKQTLAKLLPDMLRAWEKVGGEPGAGRFTRIALTIGGVDQMWKLKAIRETLHNLDDKTQKVVQRSYSSGLATFSLDSKVSIEELSELLVVKAPQGLKLQVLNIGTGELDLRAVAAP